MFSCMDRPLVLTLTVVESMEKKGVKENHVSQQCHNDTILGPLSSFPFFKNLLPRSYLQSKIKRFCANVKSKDDFTTFGFNIININIYEQYILIFLHKKAMRKMRKPN
jgi:hypothetical protein